MWPERPPDGRDEMNLDSVAPEIRRGANEDDHLQFSVRGKYAYVHCVQIVRDMR